MLIKLNRKRGQNTAEYAILIGLIISAAIAMQVYVKRGWQGHGKDLSDDMTHTIATDGDWVHVTGNTGSLETKQYEPNYLKSQSTRHVDPSSFEEETYNEGGTVTRSSLEKTGSLEGDYREYEYGSGGGEGGGE